MVSSNEESLDEVEEGEVTAETNLASHFDMG